MNDELEQRIIIGVDGVLDSLCTWHNCTDCPLSIDVIATVEVDGKNVTAQFNCLSLLFTRLVVFKSKF